jgi:serine/threonine protein kinase
MDTPAMDFQLQAPRRSPSRLRACIQDARSVSPPPASSEKPVFVRHRVANSDVFMAPSEALNDSYLQPVKTSSSLGSSTRGPPARSTSEDYRTEFATHPSTLMELHPPLEDNGRNSFLTACDANSEMTCSPMGDAPLNSTTGRTAAAVARVPLSATRSRSDPPTHDNHLHHDSVGGTLHHSSDSSPAGGSCTTCPPSAAEVLMRNRVSSAQTTLPNASPRSEDRTPSPRASAPTRHSSRMPLAIDAEWVGLSPHKALMSLDHDDLHGPAAAGAAAAGAAAAESVTVSADSFLFDLPPGHPLTKPDQPQHQRSPALSATDMNVMRNWLVAIDGCDEDPQTKHLPRPDQVGDYEVFNCIGAGRTAVVYSALNEGTGESAAIKVMKRKTVQWTKNRSMPLEAWALAVVQDHPNVPKLYGVVDDEESGAIYLISERCKGAPITVLDETTATCNPVNPTTLRQFAQQMLSVMARLEQAKIVHGDIKFDNVLVWQGGPDDNSETRTPVVKLIDFGTASHHNQRASISITKSPQTDAFNSLLVTDDVTPEELAAQLNLHGDVDAAKRLHEATEMSFLASINFYSRGLEDSYASPLSDSITTPASKLGTVRALRAHRLNHATQAGARFFSAPELLDGANPATASDLFALGVMLFAAATGRGPVDTTPNQFTHAAALREFLRSVYDPKDEALRTPHSPHSPISSPKGLKSPTTIPVFKHASCSAFPEFSDEGLEDNATEVRMMEALLERGLSTEDAERNPWLPWLISTLLHPQPFYRSTPIILCDILPTK